jgi:hypothetical protein
LRIEGFLEAVAAACERTGQEIVRLIQADALMARQTEGKGKASKLPQLKDLLLRRPLVSARMIRKALKVSPEGASYLLKQLAPVPREVTGQRSYRVWGFDPACKSVQLDAAIASRDCSPSSSARGIL